MPIFDDPGTVIPAPVQPSDPVIIDTASVYQNINSRTKQVPHIEGNTLTVNYYGKFLGSMDPAHLPSDIENPSLVQYQLINGLEIRVTQPLTQVTDPQNQTTTVTGAANMYPIVIPIIGDVFVAPIGDGTWSTFVITSAERQSIYKDTAWQVEYTLDQYASQPVLDALNEKVVTTLYFDLQGLQESGGALMTESEFNRTLYRQETMKQLMNWYYDDFYKPLYKTFLVPDEEEFGNKIFDPHLVTFWNTIFGEKLLGGHPVPDGMDTRHAIYKTSYVTVWDALLQQSRFILDRAVHSMQRMETNRFLVQYVLFTIHSTGYDYIVQPLEDLGDIILGGTDLPVDPLEGYIFNSAFYTNANVGQTALEVQVNKAIDRIILSFADMKLIVDDIPNWTPLERFYQIPFVLALLTLTR